MNWGIFFAVFVVFTSVAFLAVRFKRADPRALPGLLGALSLLNLGAAMLVTQLAGPGLIRNVTVAVLLIGSLGCIVAESRVQRLTREPMQR